MVFLVGFLCAMVYLLHVSRDRSVAFIRKNWDAQDRGWWLMCPYCRVWGRASTVSNTEQRCPKCSQGPFLLPGLARVNKLYLAQCRRKEFINWTLFLLLLVVASSILWGPPLQQFLIGAATGSFAVIVTCVAAFLVTLLWTKLWRSS